jgi:two-component system chemotaxis sensor kinase CheA
MDTDLTAVFVAECEEALVSLNNATLALEADPTDAAAMDDLFRRAHTLKGNFGAMGYPEPAGVAHAVEDLLDAVRADDLAVTPERMDLVFDGLDAIAAAVDDVAAGGDAATTHDDLVAALRAAATDSDPATGDASADPDSAPTDSDPFRAAGFLSAVVADAEVAADGTESQTDANETTDGATHVVQVRLRDGGLRGVDAGLFLDALPERIDRLDTTPSEDALRAGEFDGEFELVVGTDLDAETLTETVERTWACDTAVVTTVGDDAAAAEESADAVDDSAPVAAAEPTAPSAPEIRAIRVDVDQLDGLYELVEQLVTTRIKLRRSLDPDHDSAAIEQLDELEKSSAKLQNQVMRMRLIPLSKVFDKFPRLVRDLCRAQDKQVDFRVRGSDVELDRTILDALGDPVMHLLRNAVDHGVESPADREAAGKPPAGTIELAATREHDRVVITLTDDGAGLDPERIRAKAVERGLVSAEVAANLDDDAVFDFVFEPGFSTAAAVTDVSGRGVGMDAVRTAVTALDGSVSLDSTPGEGTTVTVRLPVSVAIVKILLVAVGDEEYGVPVDQVAEIRQYEGIETINGREVFTCRETLDPVIRLRSVLGVAGDPDGDGMLLRITPETRPVVLHCDAVRQQEEVVVKPFAGALEATPGMAGAAVVGEGDIVPIIDVASLPADTGRGIPPVGDLSAQSVVGGARQ